MVSFDGGSASKVDDVTALPSRHKMADVLLWQRYDNKMVAMRYYGNVMTTTRWRLCVTILHLQQYSHRLNLFLFDIATAGCRTKAFGARHQFTEASLTWRV